MTTSTTSDRARRRARIFAFAIAGFFLAGAGLMAAPEVSYWWGARELRASSEIVEDTGPIETKDVPLTYRAVVRVENRAGGRLVLNTERVWFRRPFESRIETYKGFPGDERSSLRQSVFGTFANASSGSDQPLRIAAPPSIASGDVRFDPVIEEAIEESVIERREVRRVYGRLCQVYRAGGPVSAGDLKTYEEGASAYADVCLDENGIVLEEYWVEDGELLRRRAITELEIGVDIPDSMFDITIEGSKSVSPGSIKKVPDDPSKSRVPLWLLPETPEGFERRGRFTVTLSDQAIPQLSGELGFSAAPTSASDVYVRGPDILVIDQDPSLTAVATQESRPMIEVDLGELGKGTLVVDARMSEVRGLTAEGSLVRLFGTLPPSELVELARSLRPVDNQG